MDIMFYENRGSIMSSRSLIWISTKKTHFVWTFSFRPFFWVRKNARYSCT